VLVDGALEDTGKVDPDTCRPILLKTTQVVGLSMEINSKAAQHAYATLDADSRKVSLDGSFIGLGSLPSNMFTGGYKTVLFAYAGSECKPVWCKFTADVQSMGVPSLVAARNLSLPVSIRGEAHFRPIDIDQVWEQLING
jgi:hypothetical protein